MSIKQNYDNAEDIPAGLEQHYSKTDTGFAISVDGLVDKGRLDEFRENNINLRKEVEDYSSKAIAHNDQLSKMEEAMKSVEDKYSGIDLEEWKSLQAERKAVAEKELIDAGDVNKLIEQRVQEVLAAKEKELQTQQNSYETQISSLQENISGYDIQLNKMLVDNELTKIAADKGVRSSALEDVLFRGRNVFRVEDGRATAFTGEGRQMYMEDAVTPLSIDGWLEGLTSSAPHLFETSSGSGMKQPTSSPASAAEPMTTEQMILQGLGNLR